MQNKVDISNVRRSIQCRFLHFPVLHFPPLHFGPAISNPAFSTHAVWCRIFKSRIFRSRISASPSRRHDASTNREEFARKSKLARVVGLIELIHLIEWKSHVMLVFEEDIGNSCGKQIRTGWSSGSSDSSETGSKKKPAGVLRTDLRRGRRGAKLR